MAQERDFGSSRPGKESPMCQFGCCDEMYAFRQDFLGGATWFLANDPVYWTEGPLSQQVETCDRVSCHVDPKQKLYHRSIHWLYMSNLHVPK